MTPPPLTDADRQLIAVIDRVCEAYGATPEAVRSRDRHRIVMWARQVAYYALSQGAYWTGEDIARAFDRDHSSVSYGVTKVRRRIATVRDDRTIVEWVMAVFNPEQAKVFDEISEVEEAIRRIDSAIARATVIRGVLVTRQAALSTRWSA